MSRIIIDGYNVIGILHKDLERARDAFVEQLIRYRSVKAHDITVVFDGYKQGYGNEQMIVRGGVKIIYSGLGERADEVIKRIIAHDRAEWLVISSDREISSLAWTVGSIPIPSEEFHEKLLRQTSDREIHGKDYEKDHQYGEERSCQDDNEPDDIARQHRGNPRQLSKKNRAIQRAISKL